MCLCVTSQDLLRKKKAQEILEKATKHKDERYEVELLWADDDPNLPNNYDSAYQQFLSMKKRLGNDAGLKKVYKATIEKGELWISTGMQRQQSWFSFSSINRTYKLLHGRFSEKSWKSSGSYYLLPRIGRDSRT